MENNSKNMAFTCLAAMGLGVLLHFLFQWFPNPLFALISPVRESVWEHVKLIYFPLLAASLYLTKGSGQTPWLVSLLAACAVMLGAGWVYHIAFMGDSLAFDLLLYVLLILAGFLLPRLLWPLTARTGAQRLASLLTLALGVLIIWFTFFPPSGPLFAGLGGSLRTFRTIPV